MSRKPEPFRTLSGAIKKDRALARRQGNSPAFFGTGMHPNGEGGIDSDNYVAGASGYSFGSDGNAEFNDLTLRGGIIGNDALTNPVKVSGVWQTASNFTVAVAWSTIISTDVTVPAGFTACTIQANGRVTAFYNNAGTGSGVDYLYANMYVGAATSGYYPLAVTDNGGSGTNHVFRHAIFTSLTPGGTINFALQTSTGFNTWTSPSSPGNQATMGASISWYR